MISDAMMRQTLLVAVFAVIALMLFSAFWLEGLPLHVAMAAGTICIIVAVEVDRRSRSPRLSMASLGVGTIGAALGIVLLWSGPASDPARARVANNLVGVCFTVCISAAIFCSSTNQPRR
jgi:hypothetical protein